MRPRRIQALIVLTVIGTLFTPVQSRAGLAEIWRRTCARALAVVRGPEARRPLARLGVASDAPVRTSFDFERYRAAGEFQSFADPFLVDHERPGLSPLGPMRVLRAGQFDRKRRELITDLIDESLARATPGEQPPEVGVILATSFARKLTVSPLFGDYHEDAAYQVNIRHAVDYVLAKDVGYILEIFHTHPGSLMLSPQDFRTALELLARYPYLKEIHVYSIERRPGGEPLIGHYGVSRS